MLRSVAQDVHGVSGKKTKMMVLIPINAELNVDRGLVVVRVCVGACFEHDASYEAS